MTNLIFKTEYASESQISFDHVERPKNTAVAVLDHSMESLFLLFFSVALGHLKRHILPSVLLLIGTGSNSGLGQTQIEERGGLRK